MSKNKSAREIVSGHKAIKVGKDDTLNDVLSELGMEAIPTAEVSGSQDIIGDNDAVVFTGTNGQVWQWLKSDGRIKFK